MIMKPNTKQCEIARAMTRSKATDLKIAIELATMTEMEWYKQCEILNNILIEHNKPLDKGWDLLCDDFYNIASANNVDEATLFVAFMSWLNKEKENK